MVDPAKETIPPSTPLTQKWLRIRAPINPWLGFFLSVTCLAICFGLWWFFTNGEQAEDRIISPTALPSPSETFASFHSLWFDRALTRNTWVTLRRVALGFALALAIGVPLGVLAGCFAPIKAFLSPLILFGRNIPLAALIPLTFFFFGIGETQKVMFIFIATAAFILADAADSIADVSSRYIDTAYTLGANRWQVIMKVLVPLAMPAIFNSARLLFGLAFGYIMLAELIRFGSEEGGLGNLINVSQKRGPREHIYLIILIIPVIALAVDRILFWIQRELFPYRYGSAGIFHRLMRAVVHQWEDAKGLFFRRNTQLEKFRSKR